MAMATLTTRLDPADKVQFEYFCDSLGMTCSTAVNLLIKNVLRSKRMPELYVEEIPNAGTIMAMREAEDIASHPENYKSYTPEELFEELGI